MKLDLFLQKSSNIYAENRILKLFVAVIGTAVLINTYFAYQSFNSMRVVLVPPVIDSRMEISGDKASDEYIKAFTRYVCGLALSYNAVNARSQFAELLTMYAPESFPDAKKTFYNVADAIETTKASSAFMIHRITVDSTKHQIEIQGPAVQFAQDKKIDELPKTYIMDYRIRSGRFEIMAFKEKELK